MNINNLIESSKKPEVYTEGTAVMWTDEYISTQLLETHLGQETDLASRKESTVDLTIDWILEKVPGENLEILDLGCGPGLYSEKLTERGHVVTGIDFSENSIRYAKKSAKKKKLNISYIRQNYLELDDENKYDLVILIFTDFGVLLPEQQKTLLENIYRALKPGGIFVFDVLNKTYSINTAGQKSWEASDKGFWRNSPYLALTESFYYDSQGVALTQHTIIDSAGKVDVYRFWIHTFSCDEVVKLLSQKKFINIKGFHSVIPDSVIYKSDEVTFYVAVK